MKRFVNTLRIAAFGLCLIFPITPAWADSTGFNPVPIEIEARSDTPVGAIMTWASSTLPTDAAKWLECNGQPIDAEKYPDLAVIMGTHVPDYRDRFLRGGKAEKVGQKVEDSVRSHGHEMDQHTHTVSGTSGVHTYNAPATSGGGLWVTAHGGQYIYRCTRYNYWNDSSTVWTVANNIDPSQRYFYNGPWYRPIRELICGTNMGGLQDAQLIGVNAYASSGASTPATTSGGTIAGVTSSSGPTSTHNTGGAETAPKHTHVRYFVRALP